MTAAVIHPANVSFDAVKKVTRCEIVPCLGASKQARNIDALIGRHGQARHYKHDIISRVDRRPEAADIAAGIEALPEWRRQGLGSWLIFVTPIIVGVGCMGRFGHKKDAEDSGAGTDTLCD